MILTDEEFASLQALQQRMLDEALEQGLAPSLVPDTLGAISARLAVVAQIDTVLGASTEAVADDDDAEDLDAEDDADALDDEPIEAARRLSRE